MKKAMIGVVPLVDTEKESYWMVPGYMQGIQEAGGLPVMLPLTADRTDIRQIAETMDGFLFTGGHDVSPEVYGEKPLPQCGECCPERDAMEKELLLAALELDKPVLGICRGIQFINGVLGGTLYQDLPSQRPSDVEHHQTPPYDIPVHKVEILRGTPLWDLLQKNELSVNSYHHQAIKKLSPQLQVMAVSEDGLTEAVRMEEKNFVWAVQWHPEFSFLTDPDSRKIFQIFVEHADQK